MKTVNGCILTSEYPKGQSISSIKLDNAVNKPIPAPKLKPSIQKAGILIILNTKK